MTFNSCAYQCQKGGRHSRVGSDTSSFYSYTSTFGAESVYNSKYAPSDQESIADSIQSTDALQRWISVNSGPPVGFEDHSAVEYRALVADQGPMDDDINIDNDANYYADYARAELDVWKQQLARIHHPLYTAACGLRTGRGSDSRASSVGREAAVPNWLLRCAASTSTRQGEEPWPGGPGSPVPTVASFPDYRGPWPDYRGIPVQQQTQQLPGPIERLKLVSSVAKPTQAPRSSPDQPPPSILSITTRHSTQLVQPKDTCPLSPLNAHDTPPIPAGVRDKIHQGGVKGKLYCWSLKFQRGRFTDEEWAGICELVRLRKKTIGNGSMKRRRSNKNKTRMILE